MCWFVPAGDEFDQHAALKKQFSLSVFSLTVNMEPIKLHLMNDAEVIGAAWLIFKQYTSDLYREHLSHHQSAVEELFHALTQDFQPVGRLTDASHWILCYSSISILTEDHPTQAAVCQMGNSSWVGGFHGDQPQLLMCQAYTANTDTSAHTYTHRCSDIQHTESNDKQHWFPPLCQDELKKLLQCGANNYHSIRAER